MTRRFMLRPPMSAEYIELEDDEIVCSNCKGTGEGRNYYSLFNIRKYGNCGKCYGTGKGYHCKQCGKWQGGRIQALYGLCMKCFCASKLTPLDNDKQA